MVKLGNTSKHELIQIFTTRFEEIICKIKVENMILLRRED